MFIEIVAKARYMDASFIINQRDFVWTSSIIFPFSKQFGSGPATGKGETATGSEHSPQLLRAISIFTFRFTWTHVYAHKRADASLIGVRDGSTAGVIKLVF